MKIFEEVYKETHKQVEEVYESAFRSIVKCLKLSIIKALNEFVYSIHYIPESAQSLTIEIESFEISDGDTFLGKVVCTFNGVEYPRVEKTIILAQNIQGVLVSGINSTECRDTYTEYRWIPQKYFSIAYIHSLLGNISINDLFDGEFSITFPLPSKP